MNYFRQLRTIFRHFILNKSLQNLLDKGKPFSNQELDFERVLCYLNKDNKRLKGCLPFVRNIVAKSYKMLYQITPYAIDPYPLQAKQRYFQLKERGLLVDAKAADYKGQWLTAVVDLGAYIDAEGKYQLTSHHAIEDEEFKKRTFFFDEVYSGASEQALRESIWYYNEDAYPISTCRLATGEEIQETAALRREHQRIQDLIERKQNEIKNLSIKQRKYKY